MNNLTPIGLTKYQLVKEARRLKSRALEYLYPTRCAACEQIGSLLCANCRAALPFIDQSTACRTCGAPLGRLVCTECTPIYGASAFPFKQACCALEFNDMSRRLILTYKDGGERRLAPLLARLTVQAMPPEWHLWADLMTWVPADALAYKRRGFDHMALIASSAAARIGRKAVPLLHKHSMKDQRLLNRHERQVNMSEVFTLLEDGYSQKRGVSAVAAQLKGKNIILLDDVFTTGATLAAATNVLLTAKVREVRVATMCRVW